MTHTHEPSYERPEWASKCERILGRLNGHYSAPSEKEALKQIMEVLEEHGFVDTDWRFESDGYFDE